MFELLVNYYFWYNVSSYNFCCYQFRVPKNEDNIGKVCDRRINQIDRYDSKSNRKYYSKPTKNNSNIDFIIYNLYMLSKITHNFIYKIIILFIKRKSCEWCYCCISSSDSRRL